jgi:hypothetical protein
MRAFKHFVGVLIAAILAAVCVVAGGSAALARGSGGGFGGEGPLAWSGSHLPDFGQGVKVGWHGNSVPPGWSKGHKNGSDGHYGPPGLYVR